MVHVTTQFVAQYCIHDRDLVGDHDRILCPDIGVFSALNQRRMLVAGRLAEGEELGSNIL
jgi:hypothetical protein